MGMEAVFDSAFLIACLHCAVSVLSTAGRSSVYQLSAIHPPGPKHNAQPGSQSHLRPHSHAGTIQCPPPASCCRRPLHQTGQVTCPPVMFKTCHSSLRILWVLHSAHGCHYIPHILLCFTFYVSFVPTHPPSTEADDLCSQPPNLCNDQGYLTKLSLSAKDDGNLACNNGKPHGWAVPDVDVAVECIMQDTQFAAPAVSVMQQAAIWYSIYI